MGLLKIGSFYKKNKSSQKKTAAEKQPTATSSAPSLPVLSLDAPLPPAPSSYQQQDQQQQITAGSGGLFDDILAELGSPSTKENTKTEGFDDFSLALALSHQLELEAPSNTSRTVPKKEEKKIEKKSELPSFMAGDSIYSSYLRHFDSPADTNEGKTSMFDSLLSKDTKPMTSSAKPTPTSTLQVLDSDVSDSDDQKKSEEEEEDDKKQGRRTLGMQPIMERRGQGHRLKRKIDGWNHRLDPEAQKVDSQESMIERMKDRHRQQAKWAALQRQQDVFRPVMVPPPYGVLPHPRMMDLPPLCHPPPPMPAPLPQEEPKTNESRTSLGSVSSTVSSGSPLPLSPSPSDVSPSPAEEKVEEVMVVTDGTEADVETSEDEEEEPTEKPKRSSKHRPTAPPPIQTMRSSRSAPNLKKKKRSVSRRNSQENASTTPSSHNSDYPLTPPAYYPHPPVRHMKSEPELINHRKRQQMQHHQQQLQFEWDRMQAYQREQQLKMMQQQQYMSMYPMMYYNPPAMMPSSSSSTTLLPPTHPRMSHSYTFHTTR